ncbi:MAG: hypothetical protein ACUVWS_08805 [Roseiflexus sp.]
MPTRTSKPAILIGACMLVLFIMACSISASTANIADAWMATDETGSARVTTYSPFDTFFAIIDLRNAPATTRLKAVWTAVNIGGNPINEVINETSAEMGSGILNFRLSLQEPWPSGEYKVDIYLNDKLEKTLTFEVQ